MSRPRALNFFGEELQKRRIKENLSRKTVSEACSDWGCPMTPPRLRDIELKKRWLSEVEFVAISKAIKIKENEFNDLIGLLYHLKNCPSRRERTEAEKKEIGKHQRESLDKCLLIPDSIWAKMERLIPKRKLRKGGKTPTVDRAIVDGIFFVLRGKFGWTVLDQIEICPREVARKQASAWLENGVFEKLWELAKKSCPELRSIKKEFKPPIRFIKMSRDGTHFEDAETIKETAKLKQFGFPSFSREAKGEWKKGFPIFDPKLVRGKI